MKCPETNLSKGKVNLSAIGIPFEYSRKVFIGGLPKDITEGIVIYAVDCKLSVMSIFSTINNVLLLQRK